MAQRLAIQADLDPRGVVVGADAVKRQLNGIGAVAEASNRRVGAAASFSGERLARYGTTIGVLTGSFQRLGVQNDIVARTITVVGEGFMGMMGPIGWITLAVGALAAGIGYLIGKHRELREELERSKGALLESLPPGMAAGIPGVRQTLEADLRAQLKERADLMRQIAASEADMNRESLVAAYGLDQEAGAMDKAARNATNLHAKLDAVQKKILALQTALGVGVLTMPEIVVRPQGGDPVEAYRTRGRIGADRGATYGAAGPGAELRRLNDDMLNATIKIIPDKGAEIVKAWRENVVDPMQQSLANGIYGAFQAGKRGVDELGSYMLDFFTNNIFKAISEKLAEALAARLDPTGGFISALLTGSFGKDKSAAVQQNKMWRQARGSI